MALVTVVGMGNELSPGRRMEIIGFSPVVSGESVSGFCRRVGISRASYYRIRRAADEQGQVRALTAASRAPKKPARKWGADTDAAIARVRTDLQAQGKEPGPWSVWWVLSQGGSRQAPSRSTIARRMRALGLIVPAPRKRPRNSWKRFTRTSANELWQLDGIEWHLAGRLVTIYQVVDDCSRVITALTAFWGGESHQGYRPLSGTGDAPRPC